MGVVRTLQLLKLLRFQLHTLLIVTLLVASFLFVFDADMQLPLQALGSRTPFARQGRGNDFGD